MKSSNAPGPSLSVHIPNTLVNFALVPVNSCAQVIPPRPTSDENMVSVAKVSATGRLELEMYISIENIEEYLVGCFCKGDMSSMEWNTML
eukprot:15253107-Ditylum_brightwellii.AAC.1